MKAEPLPGERNLPNAGIIERDGNPVIVVELSPQDCALLALGLELAMEEKGLQREVLRRAQMLNHILTLDPEMYP